MHDIKAIRQNPESFDAAWARRGLELQTERILKMDGEVRMSQQTLQEAEASRNKNSKLIGKAMGQGDTDEAERLKTEVAGAKKVIEVCGEQVAINRAMLEGLLATLPNLPADSVPQGEGEEDNVELRKVGTPRDFDFEPQAHDDLGVAMGLMDFETAAKISGARFVILKGHLSRLNRAIRDLMLDMQTDAGWEEYSPPYIVQQPALYGTGQLPKFDEDVYEIANKLVKLQSQYEVAKAKYETRDEYYKLVNDQYLPIVRNLAAMDLGSASSDIKALLRNMSKRFSLDSVSFRESSSLFRDLKEKFGQLAGSPAENKQYLIPTAEVPLTNLVREEIVDPDTLPLRATAHTACFRSEAGSAGRDTKGMIRQHQFDKVELVTICTPEESEAEHDKMLAAAEAVLQKLELPYRVVELCTGDLGFSAQKTYDLEVWLPSQGTYREISSVSNCGDFQARRMNARYRAGEKDNRFVHTLNGSGLAVGRTLVAILENYQNEDGSVTVPEALRGYMGGVERIV